MPSSLKTSSMVSCSKDRKCKKPCQSSSSSSCCTEQCVDCCTSQYQRLSRFVTMVAEMQVQVAPGSNVDLAVNLNSQDTATALYTRCGALIAPPNTNAGVTGQGNTAINGAYLNESAGCSGSGDAGLPTSFVESDGALNAKGANDMLVAAMGYYYVNQMAYGPYEPGCHNDQVYGWYVDVNSGELQLFMQMDGVPTNATRLCLSSDLSTSMTSTQKKQLKLLNKLYKLSKSAIKEVNGIPSQEGNIVEVCDCKGDKWLLYVNTASSQNGSPLSACNYQFAIVATKLC